jgi:hypothetical protein
MLVFQFKIILIRLLSGTPTWLPWLLLSWSLGNECKRSIQAGLNLQTLQNRGLKSKHLGTRLAKPAYPLFTINAICASVSYGALCTEYLFHSKAER